MYRRRVRNRAPREVSGWARHLINIFSRVSSEKLMGKSFPSVLLLMSALTVRAADTAFSPPPASGKPVPGLKITFTSLEGDKVLGSEADTTPNVWLYVPAGKSPSPFLPGGKFSAVWTGTISAELRGDFLFQADLNGELRLEINGAPAFEAAGTGGLSPLSKLVRLNKGANQFKATFLSPANGDAFVRLRWTEKGPITVPIPSSVFMNLPDSELNKADTLRFGRELLLEF